VQDYHLCPAQNPCTFAKPTDDSPEIRKLFSFAKITEWTLQYGMNNYKQKFAAEGRELLIKNY
jgi:hypothetical protein